MIFREKHLNITINNVPVEQLNSIKSWGIHLDDNLSWNYWIKKNVEPILAMHALFGTIQYTENTKLKPMQRESFT